MEDRAACRQDRRGGTEVSGPGTASVGFAKYGIIRVMKIDERCLPYAEYAELVAAIKSALK